jgi:hypothetical protein
METQEAALLITVEISPEYSTQIVAWESESLTQSEQIRAMVCTDQESYERAVEQGRTIASFMDRVEKWFEPLISPLRTPLNKIYEARKGVLDVATEDKKHLARIVGKFLDDREREKKRLEAEQAAEARRLQEEAKLNAAVQAEASGLSERAVETILATPVPAAPPPVQRTYDIARGSSGRKNWFAQPIAAEPINGDLNAAKLALCVAIAGGRHDLLPYITENQSSLNKKASAETTSFSVPGWEAKYTSAASFRKAV